MEVLEITKIHHPGRDGKNIHDFYYRDYETDNNGLRSFVAQMISSGEIINRYVALEEDGDHLTIITIFANHDAYDKWESSPILAEVRDMWEGREWEGEKDIMILKDLVEVRTWEM
jgi:hypothetical protein